MTPKGYTFFWRASKRRWVLKWKTPEGYATKLAPEDFGRRDKAAAERWRESFLASAEGLQIVPRMRNSGHTLAERAPEWFALCRSAGKVAPATISGYEDVFRNIVLAPFTPPPTRGRVSLGDQDVASLGTDVALLRSWIRETSKVRSPYRVRAAFFALRVFFDDAIVERWFRGENPTHNGALVRELPPLPTKAARGGVVTLPLDVVQTLIAAPKVPLGRRVRYAVALTTGLRDGELAGLTWGAVGLLHDPPRVDIRFAFRKERNPGEVLGPLKTETSEGVLPLHPAARDALIEWAEAEEGVTLLLGRPPRPVDPVFPASRPRSEAAFTRPRSAELLRGDLQLLDLPTADEKGRNYTLHACRKSFGTWLERAKVPEATRKRLMRHGAGDVTQTFYTGDDLRADADAAATVPLRWTPGVPYDAPPRPRGVRERVHEHLAAHPEAKAAEVAAAIGAKISSVATFVSLARRGLVTRPGASHGDPGHQDSRQRPDIVASPAGLEPATPGLGNRVARQSAVTIDRDGTAENAATVPQSTAHAQNDGLADCRPVTTVQEVPAGCGGRVRIVAPSGAVLAVTEAVPGEPSSAVVGRLAAQMGGGR